MKADSTLRAGFGTRRLSHRDKLALTNRVTRQVWRVCEEGDDRLRRGPGDSTGAVLYLIALALLARRGALPAALDGPGIRLLAAQLGRRDLVVDSGDFAKRVSDFLQEAESFELKNALISRLAKVFKQPWAEGLLDDALLPGWVYQCLSRRPRAAIAGLSDGASTQSASARDIAPESVPALTQWFTPAWIAEFLVDETFDRLLEGDRLAQMRFLDPACGAGHILVPAMRRLFAENCRALSPAVALRTVLEGQLFGCDIDSQMTGLAGLSIYLAAHELAPGVELPFPALYHFGLGTTTKCADAAIGSLWLGADNVPEGLPVFGPGGALPLKESPLSEPFSVVATNPPFLSHRLIPSGLSGFLKDHYNSGRFDLYAAFLSLCHRLLAPGGQMGVVCQQSFMSIVRYKELRQELLKSCDINGLIQLGSGAFGPVSGEKINSAIILAEKTGLRPRRQAPIPCWRILDAAEKTRAEAQGIKSFAPVEMDRSNFATMSGASFSFWCPTEIARLFTQHPPLQSQETGVVGTNGLFTCNNELFVRHFKEVSPQEESRFVPYDKGGGHKWYRTTPLRLDWGENGAEIRRYRLQQGQSASLPGERYYFREGITYSYIGTKGFRARLLSPGSIFDIASSALFTSRLDLHYLLGFLNSSLARFLLGVLNPTINFQIGDLRKLPLAIPSQEVELAVSASSRRAVELAKELETFDPLSPRFSAPALMRYGCEFTDKESMKRAFRSHRDFLQEASAEEAKCQAEIDSCIFDLYEIEMKVRRKICEDPWVARTVRPLATPPSYQDLLKELSLISK